MCGAFAFVLSALKIPSAFGSCSHPTGVGLGAILFGPTATAVLGLIVLLFQALLLAHGGLTTLGANVFSMAIVGPFVSFGLYALLKKAGQSPPWQYLRRRLWAISPPMLPPPSSWAWSTGISSSTSPFSP